MSIETSLDIEEIAFKSTNEMLHLDKYDLLDIINFLQIDRTEWINQFSKSHNEIVNLQQEKQKLKEALIEIQKIVKKTVFPNQDGVMDCTVPLPISYTKRILEIVGKVGDK